MKEKNPAEKGTPDIYKEIGEEFLRLGKDPEATRRFLKLGGYSEKEIEERFSSGSSAGERTEKQPENSPIIDFERVDKMDEPEIRKLIKFYEDMSEGFEKKQEKYLTEAYRKAAEKLKKELEERQK